MPCYSRVQATKMTDGERLTQALFGLGAVEVIATATQVSGAMDGQRFSFSRRSKEAPFSTDLQAQDKLVAIQRKYAELGVRAWAKRSGYQVQQSDEKGMTLINRRK